MLIAITQDHINQGIPGSQSQSPIAIAVLEIGFKRAAMCVTMVFAIEETPRGERMVGLRLPQKAKRFQTDFNNGIAVEPMEFVPDLVFNR